MNTSQKFNWKRFPKYFIFDFIQDFRKHWMITLLAGLVPLFNFAITGLTGILTGSEEWTTDISTNDIITAFVSVLYFLLTPKLLYGEITKKAEGSSWLMFPASHCEKYISMTLNSIVVFPLAFATIYLGTDWMLAVLFPTHTGPSIISAVDKVFASRFFLPFMVSSAGLCGALLFKKNKGSKTFLTSALSFIVLVILTVIIVENCNTSMMEFFETNIRLLWNFFQTFAGICCLIYVWFKTLKIQL